MSDDGEGSWRAVGCRGKSELLDSLADLVEGMSHPLDETARAFLATVGKAARQASKGKARPAHERIEALPPPPPEAAAFDIDGFRRRRREHELAARLDQLGRRNAEAFLEMQQPAFHAPQPDAE